VLPQRDPEPSARAGHRAPGHREQVTLGVPDMSEDQVGYAGEDAHRSRRQDPFVFRDHREPVVPGRVGQLDRWQVAAGRDRGEQRRDRRGLHQGERAGAPAAVVEGRVDRGGQRHRRVDQRLLTVCRIPLHDGVDRGFEGAVGVADRERRVGPPGPVAGGAQDPAAQTGLDRGRPGVVGRELEGDHVGGRRASGGRHPFGPVHLAQRHPQSALLGGDGEIGLGEVHELSERIGIQRSLLGYAYNPAYHHPVSHILPTEHVSPPPAEILGSATVAGVLPGVALEGKTRDLHHR
jgi:hypothetical protein